MEDLNITTSDEVDSQDFTDTNESSDSGESPNSRLIDLTRLNDEPDLTSEEPIKPVDVATIGNVYTLTEHKAFDDRLDLGQVTAQELKETFERAVASENAIKAELRKLKVVDLKKRLRGSFYRDEKKEYLVSQVYDKILMVFIVSNSFIYQPYTESYTNAIRRHVYEVTDEQIQEQSKKILERRAFFKKALTDPQTKEEFETFIMYRGEAKLSSEQKIVWDDIQAGRSLAKREQEIAQKAIVTQVDVGNTTFELVKHFHSNRNHDVFIVTMSERLPRATFDELCQKARRLSGDYERAWRNKATGITSPAGFMFNDEEHAQKFMKLKDEDVSKLDDIKERQEEVRENAVERLKQVAENLIEKAEESKNAPRLVNTARRANFAASAEAEESHNRFLAQTLENVAQAISDGETKYLSNIRAKTHIETLEYVLRSSKWQKSNGEPSVEDIETIEYPYPTLHYSHLRDVFSMKRVKGITLIVKRLAKLFTQTDKDKGYITVEDRSSIEDIKKVVSRIRPFDKTLAEYMSNRYSEYERLQVMGLPDLPTLRTALREYLSYRGEQKKANPIKEKERALIGTRIDGYFPTPRHIVEQMLELADIEDGKKVLEPSGGKGNIADEIRRNHPEAKLSVIEINSTLRDILIAKKHNLVGWNFLEHQENYDFVIMNPPFESHQDIHHLQHAFSLLNPGGRLVAIMGEGAFFRMDKKSVSFRNWLEDLGGTSEKLPQGSFLDSERSTGVNTRVVVINKPGFTPAYTESNDLELDNTSASDESLLSDKNQVTSLESQSLESQALESEDLESKDNSLVDETSEVIETIQASETNPLETITLETTTQETNEEEGKTLNLLEYLTMCIGQDFLEHQGKYSKMVIVPPVTKGQDIRQVYHAYSLLTYGGNLRAVVSKRAFVSMDKDCVLFRKWIREIGYEREYHSKDAHFLLLTKNTLF